MRKSPLLLLLAASFLALAAGLNSGCKREDKKVDEDAAKKELQQLNEFTGKERQNK